MTGKTVGGLALYPENNRFERMEALRLYTVGSSWFSSDDGKKDRSFSVSSRIWRFFRRTISLFLKRRSRESNRC